MSERNGNGRPGLWKSDPILANQISEMKALLANEATARQDFFKKFFDDRRDIYAECGYPKSIGGTDARYFQELFDREPIANRVVQFMPKECWQRNPTVYEDAAAENETEFETDWDELCGGLQGNSWHQDEKGSALWEACQQADVLSRIGSFGILLLGWDDGKPLDQPVDGMLAVKTKPEKIEKFSEVKNRYVTVGHKLTVNTGPLMPDSPVTNAELAHFNSEGFKLSEAEKRAVARFTAPTVNLVAEHAQELGTKQQQDPLDSDRIFGGSEVPAEEPTANSKLKLLYARPFAETLVQIVRYEYDSNNPRFGQPIMYRVTLNDPGDSHSGIGMPSSTVFVHWSRVIHLNDRYSNASSSNIFAPPVLRPVLNPVLDIQKARAASAEAYWKNCLAALSLETHPSLGGDVDVNTSKLRDMLENRNNSLQRDIITVGMTAKVIAPQAIDPTPFIAIQLEAIAIQLGCPLRILKGAERGELASSQDDANWDDRVMGRCTGYCTPRIIVQIVDRAIMVGAVSQPEGYSIEWPDFESLSKADKANIAAAKVNATAAYIQGDLQSLIQPEDFFTQWLGEDEANVDAWLEASAKFVEERDAEQAAMQEEQMAAMQDNGQDIDFDADGNPKAAPPPGGGGPGGFPPKGGPPGGKKPPFQPKGGGRPTFNEQVENAWTDAAREASALARKAMKASAAATVTGKKEDHLVAGDANTYAGLAHAHAAKEAFKAAKFIIGDQHRTRGYEHLNDAAKHYAKGGPRVKKDASWQYAQNMLDETYEDALNAFCPTGPGGGQDNSCSPNGGSGGGGAILPVQTQIAIEPTTNVPAGKVTHAPDVDKDNSGDGITDAARIGVPAMSVPPPPNIGRLPNLTPHERAVESSFADAYEAAPDVIADDYRDLIREATRPGEPLTFATDDAKVLSEAWSHPDQVIRSQNRATLNSPLHQTANAVAKRAFVRELDTLSPGDSILVTVGGCGAGKGYALKNVPEALAAKGQSKVVWDSAGDQNATENPWIQKEAESRGLKVTYIHVHADPHSQWADPNKGVVSRAANPADGRMVDAKVFADSYAIGAKNHQAFYEQHKDNPNAKFIFLDNTGKPKLTDGINPSVLKLDRHELARYAQDVVAKSDTAPAHVKRGALMGERIWSEQ